MRQWVCWRYEERDGRQAKVPYAPVSGRLASSTDPTSWSTYAEAVRAAKARGYDGVGFVFTAEDDLCGIDIDSCIKDGSIEGWAQEIIEELDSYTEISPSGTGVHILLRARLPKEKRRKGRFEVYDQGRYFTITGRHLPDTPQTIEPRQRELERVLERVFGARDMNGHGGVTVAPVSDPGGLSDAEIIRRASEAKNGEKFRKLWRGDTSDYRSPSEADLALCGMLAFWCNGDAARIDRLFRQSRLFREKWEREDYRTRTIAEALAGKTEFYTPAERNGYHGEKQEKEERRNQADRLIAYALEDVQELFCDQHGAPHALVDGEPVALTSRCYGWLRGLMWKEEQRSVSGEYLKTAAGTLAAHAEFSGNVRELHVRAAWHEGGLYYELAPGRVVKVSAGKWEIVSDAPVLFRHYPNLKPLPDPVRGGGLEDLKRFIRLSGERDLRLYTAYLITLALPHVARPILLATGVMGAGKSTASRLVKRFLDPTAPEAVRLDPRDFLQKAAHAFIVTLDNQSGMPEWAADTMCRLVTGEADSKRRLYSDDEDVIYEMRRAVLLNGINVPTERGDVLDRSLVIELDRIPDAERKTEDALWEEFERLHPRLLGALFDTLALALAAKPQTKLSRRPRLADWGEYAAAVYEVLGWGAEQFLTDWDEIVRAQNQSTLDGSPVAQAIIKFMEDKDEHTAPASELHKQLEEVADGLGISITRDKAWPKSARWLWRRIKEVLPLLAVVGIQASRRDTRKATEITLRKFPTDDSTNSTPGESREDKPFSSGIKRPADSTSNSTPGSNSTANPTRNADKHAGCGISGDSGIISGEKYEATAVPARGASAHRPVETISSSDSTLSSAKDPCCRAHGVRQCEDCWRRVWRLVHEGMSEDWAIAEVMKTGDELF